MLFSTLASLLAGAALVSAKPIVEKRGSDTVVYADCPIAPKVFIISMFTPEADVWYKNSPSGPIGSLLAHNITVPGFSPLFSAAHCNHDHSVCQLTTGESEINAASTIQALVSSPLFNLTETYFLIAGIAGINPKYGTTGAVAFSKYAIQVALQYEFDAREMPDNWTTGYFPQGSYAPTEYPQNIYGTEVFEVSEALRDMAVAWASKATLNDTATAAAYRANYDSSNGTGIYAAATKSPSVITCDVATSDVYFSGTLLGEAFENTTKLLTNGSATYCMTAQEDNATLEVMVRAALNNQVDFTRMIIMRTASDFDRPYPGNSVENNLLYDDQDGFEIAIENIYLAGLPVVEGILGEWEGTMKHGVEASNYIGDIFGSLGGEPDFGPGSTTNGEEVDLEAVGITMERRSRKDLYRRSLAM